MNGVLWLVLIGGSLMGLGFIGFIAAVTFLYRILTDRDG